ncbi:DNA replication protein DnaC [Ruminococcus sp. YE71]|uniref:ATP-binding protein n=1 Tax=unclassified Ruminococcus TaxID=2608920 RepID=UPI000885BBF8|nr:MULTISPECIES: ATP-binding protein [unclassified Ruminococcus]SDA17558.1 DNA replication protein DnaC [Ruminococcus sp. YE78]SFW27011.1 DNA replication protein DnaC [Ruminococcus sp. YE71]
MKYTHNAIVRAEEIVSERRNAALEEAEKREKYIFEKLPEVRQMREQVANSYQSLIRVIAFRDPDAAKKAELIKEKNLRTQENIRLLVGQLTGDPNFLEPQYTCPKCRDTGIIEGERCSCILELMKNFTVQELNTRSAIALHDFSEFRAEFYEGTDMQNKMRRWVDFLCNYCLNFPEDKRSILMMGGTGLGKTFLSGCVAKALADRGYEAAFGSAFDFLRRIEDEQFGRSEGDTLDSLINAELLIIDDLGAEQQKSVYETYLYNIINSRVNLRRPTIISTNLDTKQLEQRYHERIASRLMGCFIPIVFMGRDIRQQIARQRFARPNGANNPDQ